jgi:hypothetical protein
MALDPTRIPALRDPSRQNGSRAVVAKVALAVGIALAVGVAIRGGWSAEERGVAPAFEPPQASPATEHVPTVPAPPPAPVVQPEPRSGAREKRVARPKPVRLASFAPAPAPGPREDSFARRALVSAGPVDPKCVPRALKARGELAGRLPTQIVARFPVAPSGAVGRIEVLGDMTDGEVVTAMQDAVRSCAFNPGSDEYGRAELQSVTLRITFPRGASSR